MPSAARHREKVAGLSPVLEDGDALWDAFYLYFLRYLRVFYRTPQEVDRLVVGPADGAFFKQVCENQTAVLPEDGADYIPWPWMSNYCPGLFDRARGLRPLALFWADWAFVVTAVHHLVGGIAPYVLDPRMVTARLRPGLEIKVCSRCRPPRSPLPFSSPLSTASPRDTATALSLGPPGALALPSQGVSESMLELALALGTGQQKPMLMDDYSHMIDDPALPAERRAEAKAVMRQFMQDLVRCSDDLARRNARRIADGRFDFHRFDPRHMRVSVSV